MSEPQVRPPAPFVQRRFEASHTHQVVNWLVAVVLARLAVLSAPVTAVRIQAAAGNDRKRHVPVEPAGHVQPRRTGS